MKRVIAALAIYGIGLFTFMPTADADVSHGPVGPQRPGPKVKSCVGNWLVRWCPDGIEFGQPREEKGSADGRDRGKIRCRRLRAKYLARHPDDVPERLEHIHGCRRYTLDARFHRDESNNPLLQIANGIWEGR